MTLKRDKASGPARDRVANFSSMHCIVLTKMWEEGGGGGKKKNKKKNGHTSSGNYILPLFKAFVEDRTLHGYHGWKL